MISTFSSDIASPVSPALGEGASQELPAQKTADLTTKNTPPDRNGGLSLEREEMVRILEEIIRDPDTNATARCTAIRTLREIPQAACGR
jgi:hypothetical protein